MNSAGAPQLVIRQGVLLDSGDAQHTLKIVKRFTALKSVAGSPAQGRCYGTRGELILLVEFSDRSQALVRAKLP